MATDDELKERLAYYREQYALSERTMQELKWFADALHDDPNHTTEDNCLSRLVSYLRHHFPDEARFADHNPADFRRARNDILDEKERADKGDADAAAGRSLDDRLDAVRRYFKTRYDPHERNGNISEIIQTRLKGLSGFRRKNPPTIIHSGKMLDMVCKAQNPRDRFKVHLLFEGGMRPGELRSIRWEDVIDNGRSVSLQFMSEKNDVGLRQVTVTGAYPLFKDWKRWVRTHLHDPEYLFVNIGGGNGSKRGDRMSRGNIRRIVSELGRKIGLDSTPDDFRHSCATYWSYQHKKHDLSLKSIQGRLGWESIQRIDNYSHNHPAYEQWQSEKAAGYDVDGPPRIHAFQRCQQPGCNGKIFPVHERLFGTCPRCETALQTIDDTAEYQQALATVLDYRLRQDRTRQQMKDLVAKQRGALPDTTQTV